MKTRTRAFLPAIGATLFLSACGGGSGGGGGNPTTYSVGGSVTGLVGTGLSLSLNGGGALPVNANGSFAFVTPLAGGAAYVVTVAAQPTGPAQTCAITAGAGTIGAANVATVAVACGVPAYSIGGTVSGLAGSGLRLRVNGGTALAISANGNFTFGTPVASGAAYTVTIDTQPTTPSQTCTIAGDSGTVATANVASVAITCPAPPPVAGPIQPCKLVNPNGQFQLGLGFPRSTARLKNTGTVRIKVLFVDFPDVAATETPQQTFAQVSPTSEAYFTAVSYGAMNLVYDPHFQWLRMSRASNGYGFGAISFLQHKAYLQEAVDLAGGGVDYSTTDGLLVLAARNATALINGPAFVATQGFGVTAGGREILNGATSGFDLTAWGGYWANHEFGHTLGLPDLYMSPQPIHRAVGMYSIMGNIAGPARELTAFERWILGWVNDNQVACATAAGESTVTLSPVERSGGTKMVVVPLTTTTAVVAESRRVEGYDSGLAPAGVLVYFIDSTLTNSQGAMRVVPINDNDSVKSGVLLAPGGSTTYSGVNVRVLSTAANGDTVLITR